MSVDSGLEAAAAPSSGRLIRALSRGDEALPPPGAQRPSGAIPSAAWRGSGAVTLYSRLTLYPASRALSGGDEALSPTGLDGEWRCPQRCVAVMGRLDTAAPHHRRRQTAARRCRARRLAHSGGPAKRSRRAGAQGPT